MPRIKIIWSPGNYIPPSTKVFAVPGRFTKEKKRPMWKHYPGDPLSNETLNKKIKREPPEESRGRCLIFHKTYPYIFPVLCHYISISLTDKNQEANVETLPRGFLTNYQNRVFCKKLVYIRTRYKILLPG
jgi:hypothetical protein